MADGPDRSKLFSFGQILGNSAPLADAGPT